jgi:hypothetical protein
MKNKPSKSQLVLIVALIVLSFLLVSCPNEIVTPGMGSLTLNAQGRGMRTISPSSEEITIVSYRVNGVYSDTTTTFPEVTSTDDVLTVQNLLAGDWTITLDGLNEDGEVIASKTQVVTIEAGENTAVTFYLESLEGTGTVSITITWPTSVTSFYQIRATITPIFAGKEGFTVASSSASSLNGFESVTRSIEGLPTGTYQFKLVFLDSLGGEVGLAYREALNVYKGRTSAKTYQVPATILPIETPVITMDGSYLVSITCATEDVTIYYTTDGSEPGIISTVYSAAFGISKNTTVKAIAIREDRISSAICEKHLEVPAATPSYFPAAGTYDVPQIVSLSTTTTDAALYYTLDGTEPDPGSTEYTGPFTVDENTTVKAIATHADFIASAVSTAEYKIKAGKPIFSLREGAYSGTQTVSLTSVTENAIIHYTVDDSIPSTASPVFSSGITIEETTTIKAIAVKANMEPSDVASVLYTIYTVRPASPPTFSPAAGAYVGPQSIVMSASSPTAIIYYTLDGEEPDRTSPRYVSAVTIAENTTVKAYVVKSGLPDSTTTIGNYTINCLAPTFSPASGTYMESQTITIGSATSDSTIYYTLDGTDPTRTSNLYTAPFVINETTTVKALAVKNNMADSTISTSPYVIAGYSGITPVNPANLSVELVLPDGWETGVVMTGAGGIAQAVVTPTPLEGTVTYAWFLDGELALNGWESVASTTRHLDLGRSPDEVYLSSGPHMLAVEVSQGGMVFSDDVVIVTSSLGTLGEVESYALRYIGPSGGYVFYDKGEYTDGWRYLEAAPAGWSGAVGDPDYIFGLFRETPEGANTIIGTRTEIGSGKANTEALIAAMGSTAYTNMFFDNRSFSAYSAKICADYVGSGFDDWFLPSRDELSQMYFNLYGFGLGGFTDYEYCSSSEFNTDFVWSRPFLIYTNSYGKSRCDRFLVRPIRAF